jgi:hypothetical protein
MLHTINTICNSILIYAQFSHVNVVYEYVNLMLPSHSFSYS